MTNNTAKKILVRSILVASMGIFCGTTLPVYANDESASANNTEAAHKMNMGDVSVNPQTGFLNISLSTPKFGGIDLGLGINSGLLLSQSGSSYLGLPMGMYMNVLPYVHTQNNQQLLFIQGHDYYIDDNYKSAVVTDNEDETYSSGLRYQTSKMFKFKEQSGELGVKGDNAEILKYQYVLSYANGVNYYFNKQGLNIAVTDKLFINDKSNNAKHIYRIYYVDPDESNIKYVKLSKIIDANGIELNFAYGSNGLLSEIQYPKNASGEGNVVTLNYSGNMLKSISQQLDTTYNLNLILAYNDNLPAQVTQSIVNRKDSDNGKKQISYAIAYNEGKARSLETVYYLPNSSEESTIKYYKYDGKPQASYRFGHDTMLDDALDNETFKIVYATEEQVGNNTVKHIYNAFHQEIETISKTTDDQGERIVSITYSKYKNQDGSKNDSLLPATYNMPYGTITVSFNNKGEPVSINKNSVKYNGYGNPILKKEYMPVSYKQAVAGIKDVVKGSEITIPEYPGGIDPVSVVKATYGDFQQVVEQVKQDCSASATQTNCAEALETVEHHIYDNIGNLVKKYSEHHNYQTGSSAVSPITEYSYATDDSGCSSNDNYYDASLVCKETVKDDAGKSISKHYTYALTKLGEKYFPKIITTERRGYTDPENSTQDANYDDDTNEAVIKTTSIGGLDIEQVTTFKTLLEGGEFNTVSLTDKTDYNLSGMPIKQITSKGLTYKAVYDYLNARVTKKLLPTDNADENNISEEIVVEDNTYDPLGNVLVSKSQTIDEKGNIIPVTAQKQEFDYSKGSPLLKSSEDEYGNKEIYMYDSLNRLAKKIQMKVKTSK